MRGNGFATKPGIEGITDDSFRQFDGKRQRTRAKHAAQHLAKGEVKRAKTGWITAAYRRFIIAIGVMCVTFVHVRIFACVPGGMHESTLLRDKQQDYAETKEIPAQHMCPGLDHEQS